MERLAKVAVTRDFDSRESAKARIADRAALVCSLVSFLVIALALVACGGARKPCDAPIRSLDVAPSASALPTDAPPPSE